MLVSVADRAPARVNGETLEHCTFCAHLVDDGPSTFSEEPLATSTNFTVWPSLGALVPGWLLVVPTTHHLSLAILDADLRSELDQFVAGLVRRLRAYGPVATFEHGPARETQPAGCGVDHAHLHVVQTSADLIVGSLELMPELVWDPVTSIAQAQPSVAAGVPYLYVQDQQAQRWMARHPSIPSQLLRRVIAAREGRPQEFNWREFPAHEKVRETVRMLRGTPG